MLVTDLTSLAMRTSGILGVGQTPLPQDMTDAQNMLSLMMQQWRQKRWLVFRLDTVLFPLNWGQQSYTIAPGNLPPGVVITPTPDVTVAGDHRPSNVQSCYLRQNVGWGPNSYPIDFPMRILPSRQSYDQLSLKFLQSWPSAIYYDPTIINQCGMLYIWPVPVQNFFSLYIGFQQDIDWNVQNANNNSVELDTLIPAESQLAIMYNLALLLAINYKLPPDPQLAEAAKSSLNVLRQTNFALRTLEMPSALRGTGRLKNPMGGFYPEVAAGIPYTVLS